MMASNVPMKSIIVLGVTHQLQFPKFVMTHVPDPTYSLIVEHKIRKGVDFVFEEASGRGPSVAENIANSILGPGHYLDIDPTPTERPKYGIGEVSGCHVIGSREEAIVSDCPPDTLQWTAVAEQEKREIIWLKRIQAQPFKKALAICGSGHNLSLAFRLRSAEINVVRTYIYVPCHKLCTRSHRER